jgi:hypothetical protein
VLTTAWLSQVNNTKLPNMTTSEIAELVSMPRR